MPLNDIVSGKIREKKIYMYKQWINEKGMNYITDFQWSIFIVAFI